MFLHMSVYMGNWGLCMMSILIRLSGPMFLRGGLSLVRVFVPGSLSRQRPSYGEERAVRILLECILVYIFAERQQRVVGRSVRVG